MDAFVNSAPIQQGARHRTFRGDIEFRTATVDRIDATLHEPLGRLCGRSDVP